MNNLLDFININDISLAFKSKLRESFTDDDGWFITTFMIPFGKNQAIRIAASFNDEFEFVRELDIMLTIKRPATQIEQLRSDFNTMENTLVGTNYTITYNSQNYNVLSLFPNRQVIELLDGDLRQGAVLISRNYTAKLTKV